MPAAVWRSWSSSCSPDMALLTTCSFHGKAAGVIEAKQEGDTLPLTLDDRVELIVQLLTDGSMGEDMVYRDEAADAARPRGLVAAPDIASG
jgi:hypothetical protein